MMTAFKNLALAGLAVAGLAAGALTAHAQSYYGDHHDRTVVVVAPGLTAGMNDRDFEDHWRHSDARQRGDFCRNVRRDCEIDGRHSRACDLKWKYCTPQGRDYGYYYNH